MEYIVLRVTLHGAINRTATAHAMERVPKYCPNKEATEALQGILDALDASISV